MADYFSSSSTEIGGLFQALATPLGSVTFGTVDGTMTTQALLGDGANPVPQREQIISIVDRIRREALTEWDGSRPASVDIPIMFDAWQSNSTIEKPSQTLDKMAGTHPDGPERPMRVRWDTAGVIPYDYSQFPAFEWWITKVDRGSGSVLRSETGNRRRETCTVSLVKITEDDYLSAFAQRNWERKAKRNARATRARTYTVVRGDTFITIAKKKLKNSRRWREIAQLNGRRDANDLRVGERINLP